VQVYRQFTIRVDPAQIGPYAECNPPVNGTWGPFTCRGDYCNLKCCRAHGLRYPCQQAVATMFGSTTVGEHEPSASDVCPGSQARTVPPPEQAHCWKAQMTDLLADGHYFSTQAAGKGVGWELVATVRTVNSTCVNGRVFEAARRAGPGCFAGCGNQPNTSDCAITCFYQVVLGDKTRGGTGPGLGKAPLIAAFEGAFAPPANGGCPELAPGGGTAL